MLCVVPSEKVIAPSDTVEVPTPIPDTFLIEYEPWKSKLSPMVMVSPERFSMVVRALTILNPMKNKLTPAIKMQRERERDDAYFL